MAETKEITTDQVLDALKQKAEPFYDHMQYFSYKDTRQTNGQFLSGIKTEVNGEDVYLIKQGNYCLPMEGAVELKPGTLRSGGYTVDDFFQMTDKKPVFAGMDIYENVEQNWENVDKNFLRLVDPNNRMQELDKTFEKIAGNDEHVAKQSWFPNEITANKLMEAIKTDAEPYKSGDVDETWVKKDGRFVTSDKMTGAYNYGLTAFVGDKHLTLAKEGTFEVNQKTSPDKEGYQDIDLNIKPNTRNNLTGTEFSIKSDTPLRVTGLTNEIAAKLKTAFEEKAGGLEWLKEKFSEPLNFDRHVKWDKENKGWYVPEIKPKQGLKDIKSAFSKEHGKVKESLAKEQPTSKGMKTRVG